LWLKPSCPTHVVHLSAAITMSKAKSRAAVVLSHLNPYIAEEDTSTSGSQLIPCQASGKYVGFGLSLGALGLSVLYQMSPATRIRSKDYFDPHSSRYKAMRSKFFPPGFPNGWHCVCNITDLENGRVKSISALGTQMVAFRGDDGKVGVVDAFCPHMGAHLGCGTVVGNTLRCPFHAWRFDADGKCTDIPYRKSTRELPEDVNLQAYTVRVILERVFVWFDAEGRPPQWELECHKQVEAGLEDGSFYLADMRTNEFGMHCSEMALNSADPYHFQTLHAPFPLPVLSRFVTGEHVIDQAYGTGDVNGEMVEKPELALFTEKTKGLHFFGNPKLPVPLSSTASATVDTRVTFEGPTIIHFTMKTPFGMLRQIKTLLPIEPFKQFVEIRWYAERTVPRLLVLFIASIGANALDQDRPVWETKIWRKNPKLVANDGPFLDFFQWYDQFYSKSSPDVGRHTLEW